MWNKGYERKSLAEDRREPHKEELSGAVYCSGAQGNTDQIKDKAKRKAL